MLVLCGFFCSLLSLLIISIVIRLEPSEAWLGGSPYNSIDDIERAIIESDLGLNPSNNGNSIVISFPPLSTERREELVKFASQIVEEGRISVRNIRRDSIQSVKKIEKEEKIPEDDMKRFSDDIQNLTDDFITKLNLSQSAKEKEILEI